MPFWGVLTDRFGPRRIILFSILALALLVASLALMGPRLWQLYLTFAAVPLLAAGTGPLGYSAVITRLFYKRLGLALGHALMGVGLGAAILPPLVQAAVSAWGWRTAAVALGALILVVTAPAALLATRNLAGPAKPGAGASGAVRLIEPIGNLVTTRAFLLVCAMILLLGAATGGTFQQIVPMMLDRGFLPPDAVRVAAAVGIASLIARGGAGWLLDRVYAPWLIAIASLMVTLSMLLLAYGSGTLTPFIAAVLLGAGLGAEVDFVSFLIRRYFGNATFGRLFGIAFAVFSIGLGVGPLLLAMSHDRLGDYVPGLLLFAALGMGSAVLTFWMPDYRQKA